MNYISNKERERAVWNQCEHKEKKSAAATLQTADDSRGGDIRDALMWWWENKATCLAAVGELLHQIARVCVRARVCVNCFPSKCSSSSATLCFGNLVWAGRAAALYIQPPEGTNTWPQLQPHVHIHPSISPSISPSNHPSIYPSLHPSIHLSMNHKKQILVYLSIRKRKILYLSIYLSGHIYAEI